MRTGVSYMGHHNPRHLETDIKEMKELGLDDVLLAAQENDFVHFTGKLDFTPKIAIDHGIRPIAIFWGALNLFGGGGSSQFLLGCPEGFQVGLDGVRGKNGCYMNPLCVFRIQEMIDSIVQRGFQGYFIDEPTPLRNCYCPSCRAAFEEWTGADLVAASDIEKEAFRQRCVVDYVQKIAAYCKKNHAHLETIACLMPWDRAMWARTAEIAGLDSLGTDIYWVNEERDVKEMAPITD